MPLLYEQDEQIEPPTDQPIGVMFSRLVEDGKAYARAEIERQKIRAAEIGLEFRNIAILLALAAVLGLAGVVAILVVLIIALTPALVPLDVTGAVLGGVLVILFLMLLLPRCRFLRTTAEGSPHNGLK